LRKNKQFSKQNRAPGGRVAAEVIDVKSRQYNGELFAFALSYAGGGATTPW
jgi:hypothetical protein